MDRKFLKELGIEDDAIEKIMKEYGKSINDYKQKADKVDGLESQITDLTEQIQERDGQLEELKKVDADALQQRIDELQEANKNTKTEYQEKLDKQAKDFAIESYLRDQKARNPKAVKALLDIDAITLKDDKLIGIDEQVTPLKENESYLFGEDIPSGLKGRNPHEGGGDPSTNITQEQFNKMSYTEKVKMYNEDLELYQKLSKGE